MDRKETQMQKAAPDSLSNSLLQAMGGSMMQSEITIMEKNRGQSMSDISNGSEGVMEGLGKHDDRIIKQETILVGLGNESKSNIFNQVMEPLSDSEEEDIQMFRSSNNQGENEEDEDSEEDMTVQFGMNIL